MTLLPLPADWLAEHTSDAAWRSALIEAFRVPAQMLDPHMTIVVDMPMPNGAAPDSATTAAEDR